MPLWTIPIILIILFDEHFDFQCTHHRVDWAHVNGPEAVRRGLSGKTTETGLLEGSDKIDETGWYASYDFTRVTVVGEQEAQRQFRILLETHLSAVGTSEFVSKVFCNLQELEKH